MVVMLDLPLDSKSTPTHDKTETVFTGLTFVQALKNKYVEQDEFDNQFKLPKDKSISTEITFVGFGVVTSVQKQLKRLVSIDLSGKNIQFAGDLSEITGSLDRVKILNLADNRLTWQETIKVVSCLPNLKELILSSNRLEPGEVICYPDKPLIKLNSLILGRIYMNWSDTISILSKIWGSIDQIDLWDNKLSHNSIKLNGCNSFVSKINSLHLSQNYFQDIAWIPQLGQTDELSELDISNCHLELINLSSDIKRHLVNLKSLNISYNNIKDWPSISSLNALPSLINLICNDNPIFITAKSARALTVGRIKNLKSLNREEITDNYRRDSEIFYLRQTYNEYVEFKEGRNPTFENDHTRYDDLIETYGLPGDLNAKQSVDKYISVELCFEDRRITKKLPCDMRISNLQMLCKRLFALRPSKDIEIICCEREPTKDSISYPLDKEGQTLHFFSVKNNHRLLIKQPGC